MATWKELGRSINGFSSTIRKTDRFSASSKGHSLNCSAKCRVALPRVTMMSGSMGSVEAIRSYAERTAFRSMHKVPWPSNAGSSKKDAFITDIDENASATTVLAALSCCCREDEEEEEEDFFFDLKPSMHLAILS